MGGVGRGVGGIDVKAILAKLGLELGLWLSLAILVYVDVLYLQIRLI